MLAAYLHVCQRAFQDRPAGAAASQTALSQRQVSEAPGRANRPPGAQPTRKEWPAIRPASTSALILAMFSWGGVALLIARVPAGLSAWRCAPPAWKLSPAQGMPLDHGYSTLGRQGTLCNRSNMSIPDSKNHVHSKEGQSMGTYVLKESANRHSQQCALPRLSMV